MYLLSKYIILALKASRLYHLSLLHAEGESLVLGYAIMSLSCISMLHGDYYSLERLTDQLYRRPPSLQESPA